MKKQISFLGAILLASIILSSCGGGKAKEEKAEVRKMDSKLDALITDFAACEEMNSNCEAYTKASEGIQAMAEDTSVKFLVDDLFNGIKTSTSGARSAACAMAINFWVGSWDHYKNADYGRIVLDALKKEKYDENTYYGSTLGSLLSGWLVTDDEALLKDIHAVIKDKNTEKRGRLELIRLSDTESFEKAGLLDLIVGIANDETEEEEVRVACLYVLWRAEETSQYEKVENLYSKYLSDPSIDMVNASLEGLGYMKSVKNYDSVLETVAKLGTNEDYSYSCSRALTNYISYDAKDGIDTKKAYTLAVKMANDKTLKGYYRSYFIYAIEAYGGTDAILAVTKLAADSDKDVSDPAKTVLKRLKEKV